MLLSVDVIIRFLLYVLIFWLPYSPAVVEVCVVGSLILWILQKLHIGWCRYSGKVFTERLLASLSEVKLSATPLNFPIMVFLATVLVSIAASPFWEISLAGFLTKTMEWFIVYFLCVEVFKKPKHIFIALGIFVFTSFSTAFDGIFQLINGRDIFYGRLLTENQRLTAAFKTPNALANYLSGIIPLLCSFVLLYKKSRKVWLFFLAILFVCAGVLMLTYSRGALLGVVIGVVFWGALALRDSQYRRIKKIFLMALIGVVFMVLMNKGFSTRADTVGWRLRIWGDTISMIKERPFFGHGVNTYMMLFQEYRSDKGSTATYAHNSYLQLATETGLFGLGALLLIFWRTFTSAKVFMQSSHALALLSIGLLSGLLSLMIQGLFDNSFYTLQLSVYFWLITGLVMAAQGILRQDNVKR